MLQQAFLSSIVLILCVTIVQADSFDKICEKEFDDESNGSGDVCCTKWRLSFCVLEATPAGVLRDAAAATNRAMFDLTGCTKFADNVGGNMPLTCYWQYRKWAVIMIGAVALMAVIIPTLVLIARRRRRRASIRMY